MENVDVIIAGGGLAGLTLAAFLGTQGVDTLCIDRDTPQSQLQEVFDGRTTAISYGSRQILEAAGVWDSLASAGTGACAITSIDILEGPSSSVPLVFDSKEAGDRAFGWIVENRDFRSCLFDRVKVLPSVRHWAGTAVAAYDRNDSEIIKVATSDGRQAGAPLVVGADGRQSFTREWMGIKARQWAYGQQAIVCTVGHQNSHNHKAVEHFRHEGPFAILPMSDDAEGRHRSSVVWTIHENGSSPLDWHQESFDAGLAARFPARYGSVRQLGRRFAYPLSLIHAHRYTAPRMALVAEAGHGIHPIAGQGLNISLRDVAALGVRVTDAVNGGKDPGSAELLEAYQRDRRFDNTAMAGATDLLNRLFSNDLPYIGTLRRSGLHAVSRLPFAKHFFMRQAMGMTGGLPNS